MNPIIHYTPDIVNWVNPNIQYLFGSEIIEYDIKSAGLSISKEYHLLPEETLKKLSSISKDERNVKLGLERRNNQTYSAQLTQKFAEVRKMFLDFNGLEDKDIITVKNDAIFTIGRQEQLVFGRIQFRPKNIYHSYLRLPNGIEIFIGDESTDIKGMNKLGVAMHRLYLIDFIEKVVDKFESHDPNIIRYIMKFIEKFKHAELDEEYYLEFNPNPKKSNPMQVFLKVIIPLLQIAMRESL